MHIERLRNKTDESKIVHILLDAGLEPYDSLEDIPSTYKVMVKKLSPQSKSKLADELYRYAMKPCFSCFRILDLWNYSFSENNKHMLYSLCDDCARGRSKAVRDAKRGHEPITRKAKLNRREDPPQQKEILSMESLNTDPQFTLDHEVEGGELTIKVGVQGSIFDKDNVAKLFNRHGKLMAEATTLIERRNKFLKTNDFSVLQDVINKINDIEEFLNEIQLEDAEVGDDNDEEATD